MAKKKPVIKCEITMGTDRTTVCSANNMDELLDKIKSFHTIGELEKEYFGRKGTLEKEQSSGWYLK